MTINSDKLIILQFFSRHHLFTHKKQSQKLSSISIQEPRKPKSLPKVNTISTESKPTAPYLTKREEQLAASLRQQLLHRFKLFAIKMKQENTNRENGDFYEQCFNFMGNLILSNIQHVNKAMFSFNPAAQPKLAPSVARNLAPPAVPTVTIKREDGNLFVKKFSCNNCEASFPSLRHLERHSVQHTGEKPHICDVSSSKVRYKLPCGFKVDFI